MFTLTHVIKNNISIYRIDKFRKKSLKKPEKDFFEYISLIYVNGFPAPIIKIPPPLSPFRTLPDDEYVRLDACLLIPSGAKGF